MTNNIYLEILNAIKSKTLTGPKIVGLDHVSELVSCLSLLQRDDYIGGYVEKRGGQFSNAILPNFTNLFLTKKGEDLLLETTK